MENKKLQSIVAQFALDAPVVEIKPLGAGFINDTFMVNTVGIASDYILQRKNKTIFTDVPAMMNNICMVTEHIRHKVVAAGGDPLREVLTVVKTQSGELCYRDAEGEYWAMCVFIGNSVTYQRADSPALCYKGGQGIGRFQSQLADFGQPLFETIKGFHNIRWRFVQWDESLKVDKAGRVGCLSQEIDWINSRRDEMLNFWQKVETGEIPMRVTHNDTKISNILFDEQGEVLCVIDLDTVMSSTSLNDFGDAIRSYTNTGAEDDKELDKVSMDIELFKSYTEGYLSERKATLTSSEKEWLAFSARYITYEQILRFLMDYIDGDTYYKIAYPEHNLVRTHAQYRLLQSMESQYEEMCNIVRHNCC